MDLRADPAFSNSEPQAIPCVTFDVVAAFHADTGYVDVRFRSGLLLPKLRLYTLPDPLMYQRSEGSSKKCPNESRARRVVNDSILQAWSCNCKACAILSGSSACSTAPLTATLEQPVPSTCGKLC